ncbi:MAG TPA: glucose-6-phosphate dehydrogenase assembly protein OpcA, partial [Bryobacterales bacterium]|nr:glucose-6-phosphate dehydrogenase assembly protein OpcA [Bryobacterales bacterium]
MIDPEKLRRRLDEVWAGLGRQADGAGHEVMRACALTLIAAVDEEADPEAVAESLAALMREHPSRAIVVRLAAGAGDLLEADVDARCWMPFGARQQICSEQIVIRCTEETLSEVPGVILPLVVADLPVILWCASERARRSPAFAALAAPAGRLILDTFLSPDPAAGLASLAAELRQRASARLVTDLSWTRLTRWRA